MKSGFVMLAGRSNVGKSTLLNALVGTKVAIVTPKPQTTREPLRGIVHDPRGQMVFVDTPGIFLGKKDPVSKRLNEYVRETLEGVEAIVYVMDPTRAPGPEEEKVQNLLRVAKLPVIAVINKGDLPSQDRPFLDACRKVDVGQVKTFEVSAATHGNLNLLKDALFDLMPEGDAHYPDLQLTDVGHNQWLEELVREKIFLNLDQEIPYSIKVKLEDLQTRADGSKLVAATVYTTEERYKKIIIGKGGQMIKKIGMDARKEMETVTGVKIYLELTVKVDPKWQERFI
jgi:GTP-binding protein Era